MGAWVNPSLSPASKQIMGKWSYSGNRSYNIRFDASGKPAAYVSGDGNTAISKVHSTAMSTLEWRFVCMRFDPSTHLAIWLDDSKEENTTGIPASINNGAAQFEIASAAGGEGFFDGRISLAFLCASALTDAAIRRLYYRTRAAFQSRDIW